MGRHNPGVARAVVEGIAAGCGACGCALLGGEMAEMPDFYAEGEYDLAGTIVGMVDRDRILDGCQRLQILSQEQFADDFALLPPEDQDAVLRHVENGRVDTDTFSGQPWLHDLLELTLEGLLGDPVHGGNRDELGWSLISYAPGGPRPGSCTLHRDDAPGTEHRR